MPATQNQLEHPWGELVEAVAKWLATDVDRGLSTDEAARRLQQFGPNVIHEAAPRKAWQMLLGQFADWMIGLLAAAAMVSGVIGEWHDSLLIAAIVLANAAIGFSQERQAENAVAALKQLSQPTVQVWRDGKLFDLAARELVPGDVVELKLGGIVPADVRWSSVVELQTNEAPLTGESMPVDKQTAPVDLHMPLPDRASMAFAGTAVTRGHGRAIVTATAMQTELGKIAALLESTPRVATPLQRRLASFSRRLGVVVLAICLVVFVAGVLREGSSPEMMFLVAVSLAVAAVPEGLPAVITVALALGSKRMARRKAIVRQLAVVETLGSVNVICSDKTGTLTQNRMSVSEWLPHCDEREVRNELLRAAVLCNEAKLGQDCKLIGSATEAALLSGAIDVGIDIAKTMADWQREKEFPFRSDRKRMSTLHQSPDGDRIVYVKGAAETILQQSTHLALGNQTLTLNEPDRQRLERQIRDLTSRGRRLLGLARRDWNNPQPPETADEAEAELAWLGLVGIVDPPRPEARDAIAQCRTAGIEAVMITGDHRRTAIAIADDLGLRRPNDGVLTGQEIDELDDEALRRRASQTTVYARVSPEHKLRIVRAHQANGTVVAMTGDGVNDAPALKQADIGVAMGITGTDVSKEAARMILADDNFATIVAAVEEGRVVFDNIRRFVLYLLTGNFCEILVILVAILLGLPLPLLPVHLLWINLVTDGLPALALAFEPAEPGAMRRPPRRPNEGVFDRQIALSVTLVGLFMAACCLAMFLAALPPETSALIGAPNEASSDALRLAQTTVFATLSFSQLFHVLALRSFRRSFFSQPPWGNPRLAVAFVLGMALQLAIIYVPLLNDWFHTVPLPPSTLAISLAVATNAFWAVEVGKLLAARSRRQ